MTTWLHFIGNSYYTTSGFKNEAGRYGVSRRISRQDLKRIAWGDLVLLARKTSGTGAEIFGFFTVDRIAGLDEETVKRIAENHDTIVTDLGGQLISRRCGEYYAGPTWTTEASIEDITAELPEEKLPLMVAGRFGQLQQLELPERILLVKVPHRQGFRAFDLESLKAKVASWQPDNDRRCRWPRVTGQHYADAGQGPGDPGGLISATFNYTKKREGA